MYAVIESGGKQYRVELGSQIQVDRLEVQPGETITLERVLLVADDEQATVGRPFVEGAVVNADVVDQARGEKVVVFKYRPKARRRVKNGFRASLTTLRISDIAFGGTSAAKDAAKDEKKREQAEREAEKAAADKAAADQELAARLAQAGAEASTEAAAPKRTRTARASATTKPTAATVADDAPHEAPEAGPVEATAGTAPDVTEADAATADAASVPVAAADQTITGDADAIADASEPARTDKDE